MVATAPGGRMVRAPDLASLGSGDRSGLSAAGCAIGLAQLDGGAPERPRIQEGDHDSPAPVAGVAPQCPVFC